MRYSELEGLSEQERRDVLSGLPSNDLADLWDQMPYNMTGFEAKEDRTYFDDIETLHAYLLHAYVPATKPWLAGEAASHELAHAECALAVGAVGVKYCVLNVMDEATRSSVFTIPYGPATLPNLAWAAISMHPYDAHQSITDMGNIGRYGYSSRQHVAERIAHWNSSNSGILIPEPQKLPVPYP